MTRTDFEEKHPRGQGGKFTEKDKPQANVPDAPAVDLSGARDAGDADTSPFLSAAVAATQTAARGGRGETDVLGVPETEAGRLRAALSDRTGPAVLHQIMLGYGDDPRILSYISGNESAVGETLAMIAKKAEEQPGLWTRAFPNLAFHHNTHADTLNSMGEALLDNRERARGGARYKDAFERTLGGLATHKNTDVEMLLRIEGSRVVQYIRELAIQHERFPSERLAELAKKSKSPMVLLLVARHRNTPPAVLAKFARDEKYDTNTVRTTAVRHPFIEAEVLEEVLTTGNRTMISAVADNISAPKKALVDILNGAYGMGPSHRAAANMSTPEEALDAAFENAVGETEPDSEGWLLIGEMARNPALSRKLGDKMIDAQHGIAMSRLAKRHSTHPELVARIRKEADSKSVRYDALCTLEVQAGRPDPSKNVYGPVGAHPPRWEEA